MAPPQILVCFAVKEEARPFVTVAKSLERVSVLVTGMGRINAASRFHEASAALRPGLVVTAGFAGGLNPALACGAVLFQADADSGLEPVLRSAGAIAGSFYCAERVAITAKEKEQLWHKTKADAVEMESETIRQLARERGVKAATVRVVLDTANQDLPLDFNQLMTPDMRLHGPKLALAIARAPGTIPALLRFQKQTRLAAAALANVLQKVLSDVSANTRQMSQTTGPAPQA